MDWVGRKVIGYRGLDGVAVFCWESRGEPKWGGGCAGAEWRIINVRMGFSVLYDVDSPDVDSGMGSPNDSVLSSSDHLLRIFL